MTTLTSHPAAVLHGEAAPPGDKSISHRALILGALAVGETRIRGLLEGDDVLATAAALRAMGADIERGDDGIWRVHGLGVGGLREPADVLDLGNAGTGVRLLMGLVAGHAFATTFTGDASLRSRPMQRIITPLQQMGAQFTGRAGGLLPMTVTGPETVLPIEYRLPVASAQVKSAVLLAGLNAPGATSVIEPTPTRDHTENLLRYFGASVSVDDDDDGARRITLAGWPELRPAEVEVPADPSSAAFPLVAALLRPGSDVVLRNVCLNPLRAALFDTLREMGATIEIENPRQRQWEPVGDLRVRGGTLHGIEVPAARAPAMIDEYPVLAVAAAAATGRTVMRGIGELRVKESDRIAAMARGLSALGVSVEEFEDGLAVTGGGNAPVPAGAVIATEHDHRIAMAFLTYGVAAGAPVTIDDAAMIATSFPGFAALMNALGADIRPAGGTAGR